MTDKEKFRKEVERLKSNLIHGACSSQIAMETRCKEEAYNEVLAIIDTMQEEPVSEDFDALDQLLAKYAIDFSYKGKTLKECSSRYKAEIIATANHLELVSEDLEEVSKNYALNNTPWDDCKDEIQESFKSGAKWQKQKDESTTEDLGEYINELSKQFPEVSFAKLSRIAVRVANWQKEQFEKDYTDLCNGIATAKGLAVTMTYDKGMADAKEQMMAKAFDVEVKVDAGGYPYIPQMELYDYDKDVPLAKAGDRYKMILIKEG